MSRSVGIRTGSRLHFGMFSLPSAAGSWPEHDSQAALPRRHFGGVGLMIDKPEITLTVEEADAWSAQGPLAERALHFAKVYCETMKLRTTCRLLVTGGAREHLGLGTGTQLGLAVALGIAELTRLARDAASLGLIRGHVSLASRVGRGLRSALGVHGFGVGGFLVEGGKPSETGVSPLLVRHEFPEDWRLLLITPRDMVGLYGRRETDAFAELGKNPLKDRTTETLCRLVLLSLLPALAERDQATFGEALYEFNRRGGELFQAVQGGLYAHPRIEAIIRTLREFGIKGVGQSSWGPTIFALVNLEEAPLLRNWLMLKHGITAEEMIVTSARNRGADVGIVC